jgi:hypothetical protein
MGVLTNILAAFGLSSSAGLNAYLPLLVVALTARYSDFITLQDPWTALENPWTIGVLVLLALIEFFADKIPAVNHANDVLQTCVRPAAGAILFAASTGVVSKVDPVVAIVLGLLTAGAVHTAKSVLLRPAVTATTGGVANPVVSMVEDVVALMLSVIAVVLPVLISVILVLFAALVVYWLWRRSVHYSRA